MMVTLYKGVFGEVPSKPGSTHFNDMVDKSKIDNSSFVSNSEIEKLVNEYKSLSDTAKLTFLEQINQEVDKIRRESK